ncbi:hypothetical protein ACEE24_09560 [Latilactobacillus curvatus]
MRAIPRFLAPSILKSSQRGKFAPEPFVEQLSDDEKRSFKNQLATLEAKDVKMKSEK